MEPVFCSIVEGSAVILCGSAITYRPLFSWIFNIKSSSSSSRSKGNTPRVGFAKSSVGHPRTGLRPSVRTDLEMHPLNFSQPSVPSSIHNTRESGKKAGFSQLDDSMDF